MPDNFVWTKHVEERSRQRGIGANEVWSTLRYPDKQESIGEGKYKFYKQLGSKNIVLVAVPQGDKWVILTTWIKNGGKSGYRQPWLQKFVFEGVVKFGELLKRWFVKR